MGCCQCLPPYPQCNTPTFRLPSTPSPPSASTHIVDLHPQLSQEARLLGGRECIGPVQVQAGGGLLLTQPRLAGLQVPQHFLHGEGVPGGLGAVAWWGGVACGAGQQVRVWSGEGREDKEGKRGSGCRSGGGGQLQVCGQPTSPHATVA